MIIFCSKWRADGRLCCCTCGMYGKLCVYRSFFVCAFNERTTKVEENNANKAKSAGAFRIVSHQIKLWSSITGWGGAVRCENVPRLSSESRRDFRVSILRVEYPKRKGVGTKYKQTSTTITILIVTEPTNPRSR